MTGTVSEYAFKNDSITQFMAMPTFPQTIYSNYFKPSTTGSATNSLDGDFWFNETGAGIRFKDKRIGTINDFKAWLGTHNTIVYAPLSIPTYTKIEGTLANQLEALNEANSYNQQTNLFQQNNDLSFTIEAKALIKF